MMEIKSQRKVDASKYVVLDVETNGLSSVRDDLLSISIYKPDTKESYNRFLPLELQSEVVTTHINGIKTSDLKGQKPLSQDEVDEIIRTFDLKNRTILTYGGIDEKFIVHYFRRHRLTGIEYFAFYNFKHEIISSRFSEGNITKDNLCNIYKIDNVQEVHSGSNDCVLEWKLFERMNGNRLLITDNKVFEFNDQYMVPASYITTYPNMKYYLPQLPKISCEEKVVFALPIPSKAFRKFPTNFNGMILEHLINSMLHVQKIDSRRQLLENKSKLIYLGELPSEIDVVPMRFNPDGSMTATRPQDKKLAKEINSVIEYMKSVFAPLFKFIAEEIFENESVSSQELMVYPDQKVLALCDLSSPTSILEIKATSFSSAQSYTEQLYYEANGRKCYLLQTDWSNFLKEIVYTISEVTFSIEEPVNSEKVKFDKARQKIETDDTELVEFVDAKTPVKLKCKKCGNVWNTSFYIASQHRSCPVCLNEEKKKRTNLERQKKELSEEEKHERKLAAYKEKLFQKSNCTVEALSYIDSRSDAKARCINCGYEWSYRADHLLERPYCPKCRKK